LLIKTANEENDMPETRQETDLSKAMRGRARIIRQAGGLDAAVDSGALDTIIRISLSEAVVLGLLKQGVSKYFAIFGHGSTDLGEALRVYDEEGVTRTINCRNEVEMAHAATALAWQYGETCAVITSIGPGALHAMAGSLAAASNGVGVYHIYGDETTQGEGYNMQQIPKEQQHLFGTITAAMGQSYVLHTPGALRDCLRRGTACVHHPYKAGPFYLLLPLNTQPEMVDVNLATLPGRARFPKVAPLADDVFSEAVDRIAAAKQPVIKAGGGTRGHDEIICKFAERIGAAVVLSPGSTGVLPDDHPQNMHVGGSKGSISGNYAMENADLLIAIGTRAVCQADCSGVGYPRAEAVININGDLSDLMHYANTVGLPGDITAVTTRLLDEIAKSNAVDPAAKSAWLSACAEQKAAWSNFKAERFAAAPLADAVWERPALGQPAAIKIAADYAKARNAAKFFDAGDVQANGFQIVEDDRTGDTYTETGASYMGFSVSGLLASAAADKPRYSVAFTGDGSFMMNPQILIDGVEHGVKGMIVLFDNRRMAAITGLQEAQYGNEFRTNDGVPVDYVQLASAVQGVKAVFGGYDADSFRAALDEAGSYDGLSLVHVPVYAGDDPLGGMGAYGSWNVGNWVEDVQARYLKQKI
jgi:3D-(3,5/4)-trihydroxycyclohexane-1,2-dione acylhydrolase (decyclizing)